MNYYFAVFQKYAQFSGRSRRSEYWYFVLFNLIISIILAMLSRFGVPYLYNIYSIGVLIPSIAVLVRRMHDVNKSGWFILIPIYNLILACTDGTAGENEYGEDPKGRQGFGAYDYQKPFDAEEPVS
nr:DUF805 domain-containing protein [uncultured Mucilaginibacter sp.]